MALVLTWLKLVPFKNEPSVNFNFKFSTYTQESGINNKQMKKKERRGVLIEITFFNNSQNKRVGLE